MKQIMVDNSTESLESRTVDAPVGSGTLKGQALWSFFFALLAPPLLWRRWTQSRRTLPTMFVLGAPKCGTTSLSEYLAQHPNYLRSLVNEPMFLQAIEGFRSNAEEFAPLAALWGRFEEGLDSYRKFFPTEAKMGRVRRKRGGVAMTGDHTPFYLYCPVAARRIRQFCPDARFIILLRDPVSRAYSDYNMNRRHTAHERRSFEAAVEDELAGRCRDFRRCYLEQSVYEPYVRQWFELFSREQFLVLDSRRFFARPQECWTKVLDFLELPRHTLRAAGAANKGKYTEPLADGMRRRLEEYFAPRNERLYDLLGAEFPWQDEKPAGAVNR